MRHLVKTITLSLIATSLITLTTQVQALTDEAAIAKGLAIATEADVRDNGFGDVKSNLTMILRNKHGEESKRSMRNKTLEQPNDGDKALITFDNPRDVKGTSFLSYTHRASNDEQWLFLPALKRVKRIASSNKSGPFMGSEFAYEDISSQEIEKYTYRYLKNETIDNVEFFVIERDPVDPRSGYSKQHVWIDTQEYRAFKIDFYDRKQDLLKTLNLSDYHQHLNQFWRANVWAMHNHQTGKSTELVFSDWTFRNGYADKDFTTTSLKRAR
ncbi:outer membrane lipoprotein-sorting protein [Psychrobium sp. 1_MG-2023]|uniref:outer membrane lipoprotein-sorting protein n=1 Tax=Psychrobium sp. 1_MG-2023 TaxID=3062624 RepID=UPI000C32D321|nr:outer membrane lipoprotein-sorting protein [Psychrobium sp. 1_MG-2023]MDP2562436.1 outer membrane lipoprotein-sorting protein [Psychrobium sp. 1_MG-2023]PKF56164.1 outer membrane lipoprotein-sorting protein [Alteromonadales bacterium alter-6D02]